MPQASAAKLLEELLDTYDRVEDPRRLLDGLLISLADVVCAVQATVTEVIPPSHSSEDRRIVIRAAYRRDGHPIDPHHGGFGILSPTWFKALKKPARWDLVQGKETALADWLGRHDWGLPLWRHGDLIGILWLRAESDRALDETIGSEEVLRTIRTVFLPALASHRAFARFLRYEASTDRQLGIRPEARLRTPAERLFPRAQKDLGDRRMFIVQFDESRRMFHDLALNHRDPALATFFRGGLSGEGLLGQFIDRPTAARVSSIDGETLAIDSQEIESLPEERALLDGKGFRLHPIRFEKRFVGIFGHEIRNESIDPETPNRLQVFLATTARNLFYSSIYRSLLADSYRVNLLQWAARKLSGGAFDIDQELEGDLIDRTTPDDIRDAKSLADLADDFHKGLDDLVVSFRRLVIFVDTFYKVSLSGMEESAEGSNQSVTNYLQKVVRIMRERLGYEKVMALLADTSREVLYSPVLSWEFESPEQERIIQKVEVEYTRIQKSVWAWVARNGRDIYVPDASAPFVETDNGEKVYIRKEWIELFKAKSFFTVPLLSQQNKGEKPKLLGVLSVASLAEDSVTMSDINVMRALARQVSLILENAALHQDQRRRIREQQDELERQNQQLRETYFRLFRYERQEFHLDLTAGLAHDLKNPLIAGRQYLRILAMELNQFVEEATANSAPKISSLGAFQTRADELVARLGDVFLQVQDRLKDIEHRASECDPEQPREKVLHPREVLETALDDIPQTARVGVEFHRQLDEVGSIKAHPDGLRSLFMNLVVNAIESIPTECGGDVWITLRQKNGELIYIVEDNGCGIPEGEIDKIFNARYSTKPRGTGLGLAWVQRNVTQHLGGQIQVESGGLEGGKTTRFTVTLPTHNPEEIEHATPCLDS